MTEELRKKAFELYDEVMHMLKIELGGPMKRSDESLTYGDKEHEGEKKKKFRREKERACRNKRRVELLKG